MKKRALAVILAVLCIMAAGCSAAMPQEQEGAGAAVSESDAEKQIKAKKVELSGSADDSFVAQEHCYAESERVVMYFHEGVTVKGDMLVITEKIMDDLSRASGMSFEKSYEIKEQYDMMGEEFPSGYFDGVNDDEEKINVMIVNMEDTRVPSALGDVAQLDPRAYDYEYSLYQDIYHELTHVMHMRNYEMMGTVINEGFATYMAERAMKEAKLPPWNSIQYYDPYDYDDSVVLQGEEGFSLYYQPKTDNYQYGFRFVSFLYDEYGDDALPNIMKAATEQGFAGDTYSSTESKLLADDNEQIKGIIKENTSDDVFERFTKWYKSDWKRLYNEYNSYLRSIGAM